MRATRHRVPWWLGTALTVAAFTGSAQAQVSEQDYLLHTLVKSPVFAGLRIWDRHLHDWRGLRPEEIPAQRAPVVVLHLWADYCKPCKEEFPMLRALAESIERAHPGQVQFVYLSETADAPAMDRFVTTLQGSLPRGPLYFDTGATIAQILSEQRPSAQKTLPITVVLDRQRVVRQAVIGPISTTRSALVTGIGKLVRLAQQMTGPAPKE